MGKLCNILSDPIKFLNSVVWIWTFRKAGLHTNKWVILGQARFCNSLWCSDTHLDFKPSFFFDPGTKPSCHPHNQRNHGCHNQSIGGAISWLRVIPEKMLRTMWIVWFSYFVKLITNLTHLSWLLKKMPNVFYFNTIYLYLLFIS